MFLNILSLGTRFSVNLAPSEGIFRDSYIFTGVRAANEKGVLGSDVSQLSCGSIPPTT